MTEKPFSQACENNKQPILTILKRHFSTPGKILEIGSGTGQHAVFFALNLPHLVWQPSDLLGNHAGIRAWLADYSGNNILPPIELNVVDDAHWIADLDGAFTANTLHIMSWQEVLSMLDGLARCLCSGAKLIIYGPFNYAGQFTSESNARFDNWLKEQAPHRAIRNFEDLCTQALSRGLQLLEDNSMPANNRCLVFRKD